MELAIIWVWVGCSKHIPATLNMMNCTVFIVSVSKERICAHVETINSELAVLLY